jgi:hypothetical protein
VFVSRIDDVARLHAQGLSGRQIATHLGISPPTVCYYLRKLGVPRQRQGRYNWKDIQAYYDQGNSVRACAAQVCGLNSWMGEPLSLALHHVNGKKHDNRLENLQLLCPTCHSQTDNFAGRNRPLRVVVSLAEASPSPDAA